MQTLRNSHESGKVIDLPTIGKRVAAGETIEVTNEVAETLTHVDGLENVTPKATAPKAKES